MNLNIIGYGIYLFFTVIIIVKVGNICYRNGNIFIRSLMKKEIELSIQINKTLLIGYYLLNIGYSTITLITWNKIGSVINLIEVLSKKTAIIILIIAVLHYSNIYLIKKFINKLI